MQLCQNPEIVMYFLSPERNKVNRRSIESLAYFTIQRISELKKENEIHSSDLRKDQLKYRG